MRDTCWLCPLFGVLMGESGGVCGGGGFALGAWGLAKGSCVTPISSAFSGPERSKPSFILKKARPFYRAGMGKHRRREEHPFDLEAPNSVKIAKKIKMAIKIYTLLHQLKLTFPGVLLPPRSFQIFPEPSGLCAGA